MHRQTALIQMPLLPQLPNSIHFDTSRQIIYDIYQFITNPGNKYLYIEYLKLKFEINSIKITNIPG